MINYNNKKFRVRSNTENGELSTGLIFQYKQVDNILTCNYSDKKIIKGQIIGIVSENGTINLSYHQINSDFELKTGICISKPQIMPNGKIRIHEQWQWTSGDLSAGSSILEEI